MKPGGIYFDPDQIVDYENDPDADKKYWEWASKPKGKCAWCKEDVLNYEDSILLQDEQGRPLAFFHDTLSKRCYWDNKDKIIR